MFRGEVTILNVAQGGALYFLNKEHSYLQDAYSNSLSQPEEKSAHGECKRINS